MTVSKLNKQLDKVRDKLLILNDELITSGRGSEKYQDIIKQTDPLSLKIAELINLQYQLQFELKEKRGY